MLLVGLFLLVEPCLLVGSCCVFAHCRMFVGKSDQFRIDLFVQRCKRFCPGRKKVIAHVSWWSTCWSFAGCTACTLKRLSGICVCPCIALLKGSCSFAYPSRFVNTRVYFDVVFFFSGVSLQLVRTHALLSNVLGNVQVQQNATPASVVPPPQEERCAVATE